MKLNEKLNAISVTTQQMQLTYSFKNLHATSAKFSFLFAVIHKSVNAL